VVAPRQQAGLDFEARAEGWLARRGLAPVERNVRFRGGEIDLVMRDGAALVFVEVRYRGTRSHGGAGASVQAGKQRRLVRAAGAWLAHHPGMAALPCRFDVVALEGPADAPTLAWHRAAFTA
jgi:putative endonuclease